MTDDVATTQDHFLGGQITLHQPKDGYRAATDPVFLAASIPAKSGQRVLDVGSGVGAALLCLMRRVEGLDGVGIEVQPPLVALGQRNVMDNGFADQARIVEGDIATRLMDPEPNSFDHVFSNPPFYEAGSGHRPPNAIKARAHMQEDISLTQWIDAMYRMAKPKGTLTLINRMERLDETLAAFQGRVGEVKIYPLWSMPPFGAKARPAKRFLIQGRKAIKAPLVLLNGMVVHDEENRYTTKASDILMKGAHLALNL